MNETKIPEEFLLTPFFNEDDMLTIDRKMSFDDGIKTTPLIFDLYSKLQIEALKPWEEKHKYIPIILETWKVTEPMIVEMFEERDRKKALVPMRNMIKMFLMFMFWMNGRPVPTLYKINRHINELKLKPVNAIERIEYILSIPNHYHAFIQLQQLFIELKKKYAVVRQQEGSTASEPK